MESRYCRLSNYVRTVLLLIISMVFFLQYNFCFAAPLSSFLLIEDDNGQQNFVQPDTNSSVHSIVSSWYPDTHFSSPYMQSDSDENIIDSLLYINNSAFSEYGIASKAYLGLYAFYTHGLPDGLPGYVNPSDDPSGYVDLYPNTGAWNADTVTWNTAPSIGILSASHYADEVKWYLFNITDIYNSWVSCPSTNYGVSLVEREKMLGDGGWDGVATLFYTANHFGDGENPYVPTTTPEPLSAYLLGSGFIGLASFKKIMRKKKR